MREELTVLVTRYLCPLVPDRAPLGAASAGSTGAGRGAGLAGAPGVVHVGGEPVIPFQPVRPLLPLPPRGRAHLGNEVSNMGEQVWARFKPLAETGPVRRKLLV